MKFSKSFLALFHIASGEHRTRVCYFFLDLLKVWVDLAAWPLLLSLYKIKRDFSASVHFLPKNL